MARTNSYYGKPNKTAQISSARCTGSESSLDACDIERVPAENGRDVVGAIQAAGVSCALAPSATPTSGSIGALSGNSGVVGISVVAVLLVVAIVVAVV